MEEQDFIEAHSDLINNKLFAPNEFTNWEGYANRNFPGFFHINKIEDASIVFLDKAGCELFGKSMEEIQSKGAEFLLECMHPDDIERCVGLLTEFAEKRDEKAVLSYFQRVKINSDEEGFYLGLTSVRLDLKNGTFVCITNLTNQLPLFTQKVLGVLNENNELKKQAKRFLSLTKREKQVAYYLCRGKQTKEIASDLFLSVRTVEQHKKNIYKKLEVKKLSELLQYIHFTNFGE